MPRNYWYLHCFVHCSFGPVSASLRMTFDIDHWHIAWNATVNRPNPERHTLSVCVVPNIKFCFVEEENWYESDPIFHSWRITSCPRRWRTARASKTWRWTRTSNTRHESTSGSTCQSLALSTRRTRSTCDDMRRKRESTWWDHRLCPQVWGSGHSTMRCRVVSTITGLQEGYSRPVTMWDGMVRRLGSIYEYTLNLWRGETIGSVYKDDAVDLGRCGAGLWAH